LTSLNVGELQFEGKGIPVVAGAISELKFVGVLVKIVDAQDLSNNIEVFALP
jgi:hypothetical protein